MQSRLLLMVAAFATCVVLMFTAAQQEHPRPFAGSIEPEAVPIFASVGGRVAEVLARRGETVRAGQVLLRFDDGGLEQRIQPIRTSLAKLPPSQIKSATSLIERVPSSTWEDLSQSDPARLAIEVEYTTALAAMEEQPGSANQARLQKASAERTRIYRTGFQPGAKHLTALREMSTRSREMLSWLNSQLERFLVRAPRDGIVEIVDVSPGDVLAPLSGIALVRIPGRFIVTAPILSPAPVGTLVTIMSASGVDMKAVVVATGSGGEDFRAIVAHASTQPTPGETVQIRF